MMTRIQATLLFPVIIATLSCQPLRKEAVHTLQPDSSFALIMETAPVFADSCIPTCWSRVFADSSATTPYTLFVLASTVPADGRRFANESFMRKIVDSLSYPLLTYLAQAPAQPLTAADIRGHVGYNNRLRLQLIKSPVDKPLSRSTDLGYLQISLVVTDTKRGVGLYLIRQIGTGYFKWLVQIQHIDGHW